MYRVVPLPYSKRGNYEKETGVETEAAEIAASNYLSGHERRAGYAYRGH